MHQNSSKRHPQEHTAIVKTYNTTINQKEKRKRQRINFFQDEADGDEGKRKELFADIVTLKSPAYNENEHHSARASAGFTIKTIRTPIFTDIRIVKEEQKAPDDFTLDAYVTKYDTIPMMVLKDIASRQGEAPPVMQSEITGAASGAAIVGIGNIAGSILKFGSNYLLQIGFGASLYGIYSVGLALIQLLASLCTLGLDDAAIRYTAIYHLKQQKKTLNGLLLFCSIVAGIMGLLGALGLFTFAAPLAQLKQEPRLIPLFQLLAPIVPLTCTQTVWLGALQGLKLFKWRVLAERIIMPLVLLLVAVAFFFLSHSMLNIALATDASVAAGTLASIFFLRRSLSNPFQRRVSEFAIREWLNFAIFNFLTSITEVVLESIDTLLLVVYAIGDTQIGQYNAAIKISDFIAMPLFSLNTMFMPTIAELYSQGENEKLGIMYKLVNKWIVTLSLPIFCIATLFSQPLLRLSGQSFLDAWPLLVVSAIGSLINAATGSVGYMLLMTGHQKVSFFNSLLSVSLNILLGIFLIPHYGAMGTALGTTATLIIVNIVRYVQVRILLKFHPYSWDILKPLAAGAISALVTAGSLFLAQGTSFYIQLCLMPVFFVSYGLCLWLMKLNSTDMIVVDALRKKLPFKK